MCSQLSQKLNACKFAHPHVYPLAVNDIFPKVEYAFETRGHQNIASTGDIQLLLPATDYWCKREFILKQELG